MDGANYVHGAGNPLYGDDRYDVPDDVHNLCVGDY